MSERTGRPLPADVAGLQTLTTAQRHELARHWAERAASELRVGHSFEVIAAALTELGAPTPLQALARRAVTDEHRHHQLSLDVASHYAGMPLAPPAELPFAPPIHRGVDERRKHQLWVLGQCALNETFASAVLEASLARCDCAVADVALRTLLGDEVDHARLGWAFASSLAPVERAEISGRLLSLVRANRKVWRETPRSEPTADALLGHGALSAELIDQAVLVAIRDLVIPGFDQAGFEVAPIARWLRAGAPT